MKNLLFLLLVATLSIGAGKERATTRLRGDGLSVSVDNQQNLKKQLAALNELIKQQERIIGDDDPKVEKEFNSIEALEAHSPKQSKWERRENHDEFDEQLTRTPSPHQLLRQLVKQKQSIESKLDIEPAPKTN